MKHIVKLFISIALLSYGLQASGAVIIDDSFDDGDITTNTTGTGTGFGTFVQSLPGGVSPSTVNESGGSAILSTGPACAYCISVITSNDSFDFFSDAGAKVTWEGVALNDYGVNDGRRPYLAVVSEDTSYNQRLNPQDTNRPGVYVRLEDTEFPFGSVPGFLGGLIVEDGTGEYDELAAWSWDNIWDGDAGSALDVELTLDDMGFSVDVTGNLGSTNIAGLWSGIANATGFESHWVTNSAVVGAQNQGLIGIGSTDIERIVVESPVSVSVPEPSIIALFAAGLFGIGFARRRKYN